MRLKSINEITITFHITLQSDLTFAFWRGLPLDSSFISTVDVIISTKILEENKKLIRPMVLYFDIQIEWL